MKVSSLNLMSVSFYIGLLGEGQMNLEIEIFYDYKKKNRIIAISDKKSSYSCERDKRTTCSDC